MIKILVKNLSIFTLLAMLSACGGFKVHTLDHFGSYPKWLFAPTGHDYKSVGYRWDYENYALVYIYRPVSEWAMDEVEAPSFNVNGQRLFNIKGGGYTWYEFEPGSYDIKVRRGIFGFEKIGITTSKTYSDFSMKFEAGKAYYLRYSEIDPIGVVSDKRPSKGGHATGDGPLQLVGYDVAEREMVDTKMIHHGQTIVMADIGQLDLLDTSVSSSSELSESVEPAPLNTPIDQGKEDQNKEEKKVDWWPF